MWKKSSICAAATAIALVFGLLLAGCNHNSRDHYTEPDSGITDDPANGIMSVETAGNVYNWAPGNNNSVTIKKFKSAEWLRKYLSGETAPQSVKSAMGGVSASVNMAVGGPSYAEGQDPDASGYDFVLKEIGNLPITTIESNAFTPDPNGDGSDDISSVVKTIVLPETITTLGTNVFADVGAAIVVDIPPVVVEAVTGQSAASAAADTNGALEAILGGDVAIEVKAENSAPIAPQKPPANPSLESVTPSWSADGTTLTVTLVYSKAVNSVTLASGYSDSWDAFTPNSGRTIWTSTYKGGTNTETWYVPIRAATSYNGGSKTATKDVSLVNGSLARPTSGAGPDTYKIIGYFNGPDDTRIAGLAKETVNSGTPTTSTYADTVWKNITDSGMKNIFEAIYRPNAPGTTDGFVPGETDKKAIPFTDAISRAALQLFHVTLGSSAGAGDGIKIQGTALPTADGANAKNLIIIDVGAPGNVDNSGLPTFRIPDRRLGASAESSYPHIRLRVNKGAQLIIEADNSAYISAGASKACTPGYLNGGCVEAMAGGKLRDGAYEGFPLGNNAVILNRNASYLAIGSEGSTGTSNDWEKWYTGWLIGPENGDPRIVWTGGNESSYIEVRPKELAIDANVTVKKSMGLIYNVFFLNNTVVTIDTTTETTPIYDAAGSNAVYGPGGTVTQSNGEGESGTLSVTGLAVNARQGTNGNAATITDDTNYKFYAQSEGVRIILTATSTKGSSIHAYPLTGTNAAVCAAQFITAGTDTAATGVTITGTLSGMAKEYVNNSTGIVGYNSWVLSGKLLNADNIFTTNSN
jgi:hypothetical protein